MGEIIIAIAILGGLGIIFGAVLAAASKVFYVETDPRLEKLNECLPGANCGGCGYAGCGGYAEAVLNGEAEIGLCASGGTECAQAIQPTQRSSLTFATPLTTLSASYLQALTQVPKPRQPNLQMVWPRPPTLVAARQSWMPS